MALQAKLQAKYWREVEHQAHTAVDKRKAEADKRKLKKKMTLIKFTKIDAKFYFSHHYIVTETQICQKKFE